MSGAPAPAIHAPTRTESAPTATPEEDPGHLAHISGREGLAAALVEGTPVPTLCGRWLVPSRDPRRFPRCPRCLEILDRVGIVPPEP